MKRRLMARLSRPRSMFRLRTTFKVAEMVLERAGLVEGGRDAGILLDWITRLARLQLRSTQRSYAVRRYRPDCTLPTEALLRATETLRVAVA